MQLLIFISIPIATEQSQGKYTRGQGGIIYNGICVRDGRTIQKDAKIKTKTNKQKLNRSVETRSITKQNRT